MAENLGDSAGDNEMARSDAADQDGNEAMSGNLPVVVAPKLGAGEDEVDDTPGEPAAEAAAPATSVLSRHFLVLAAAVAFAAAFGSFVGSVSGSGLAQYFYSPAPGSAAATTADALRDMKLELAELSAIKANVDAASRSNTSQFAKLSDRLDRLDQRPPSATPDTTGSIAAAPPPARAPKSLDRILPDWVVQDVQDGRALVASRYGGIFDVGAGSFLPGVGRVDAIKRQDGEWLVLTTRGTITSGR